MVVKNDVLELDVKMGQIALRMHDFECMNDLEEDCMSEFLITDCSSSLCHIAEEIFLRAVLIDYISQWWINI